MTTSPADQYLGPILHIRSTPLAPGQNEGLLALGVHVEHLTPQEISDALRDAPTEDVPARRDAILQRLAEAQVCILDEGTGLKLGTFLLNRRQHSKGITYTTLESLYEVAKGVALEQEALGVPQMTFERIPKHELLVRLRGLAPLNTAPAVRPATQGPVTRAARPLPFIEDPEAFSFHELNPANGGGDRERILEGRTTPSALLLPTEAPWAYLSPYDAMTFLMCHLPTEELHLLGSDIARDWWAKIEANRAQPGRMDRQQIDTVLWHALARDGGRATLAALPGSLQEVREAVEEKWDRALAKVENDLPLEVSSAPLCAAYKSEGERVIKTWDIVPWEDPFGQDTLPNFFRPTLETFRIARRYRPAGDVLLEAHRTWRGRPYQEVVAADQLRQFVEESPPTSLRDLDSWAWLLTTLPKGRLRRNVLEVMGGRWSRIEVSLLNAIPEEAVQGIDGRIMEANIASKVPCLGADGSLREDILSRVTSERRRTHIRSSARQLANIASRNRTTRGP